MTIVMLGMTSPASSEQGSAEQVETQEERWGLRRVDKLTGALPIYRSMSSLNPA
ncbi:MAG: hypothetical protein ACYTF9_06820 [Planctomycetota bacterium]